MSKAKTTPSERRAVINLAFTAAWIVGTLVAVALETRLFVVAFLVTMTGWSGFTSGLAVTEATKEPR